MKNVTIWCLAIVSIASIGKGEPARESRFTTYDARTKAEKANARLSPQARVQKKMKDLQRQNLELKREILKQNKIILQLKSLLKKNNILLPKKVDDYTLPKVGPVDDNNGIPNSFKFPLTVGQKAYFGADRSVHVVQVIDENNFLAKLFYLSTGRRAPDYSSKTVWVKGISTKNFTDVAGGKVASPLEVTGTKRYETPHGPFTVHLLEPIADTKEKIK